MFKNMFSFMIEPTGGVANLFCLQKEAAGGWLNMADRARTRGQRCERSSTTKIHSEHYFTNSQCAIKAPSAKLSK